MKTAETNPKACVSTTSMSVHVLSVVPVSPTILVYFQSHASMCKSDSFCLLCSQHIPVLC